MSWDIIEHIILIWCEEYKKSRKIDYIVSKGKDRKAAGDLLNKFKESKLHKGKTTEEMLDAIRDYFKDCLMLQKEWFKENMSLWLVNSKVNEINQQVAELRRVRRVVDDANKTAKDLSAVGKVFGSEIKEVVEATIGEIKVVEGVVSNDSKGSSKKKK